jgi:branched-chain amino acid aminotransferase
MSTPPVTADILESITRETVMHLAAKELGMTVVERVIDRTELYVAEEVLLCGTGAEILPVRSVDRYIVGDGDVGPVTRELRDVYAAIVRGQMRAYSSWLKPVYPA